MVDVFVMPPIGRPVDGASHGVAVDDRCTNALARADQHQYLYWIRRQDRKDKPRVRISGQLVADLLMTAGADWCPTADPGCAARSGRSSGSGGRWALRTAGAGGSTPSG